MFRARDVGEGARLHKKRKRKGGKGNVKKQNKERKMKLRNVQLGGNYSKK